MTTKIDHKHVPKHWPEDAGNYTASVDAVVSRGLRLSTAHVYDYPTMDIFTGYRKPREIHMISFVGTDSFNADRPWIETLFLSALSIDKFQDDWDQIVHYAVVSFAAHRAQEMLMKNGEHMCDPHRYSDPQWIAGHESHLEAMRTGEVTFRRRTEEAWAVI